MRTLIKVLAIGLIALFTMGNSGCDPDTRDRQETERNRILTNAASAVPVPSVSNYPARAAVAKQVKRMDEVGKLYYIYLIADNGAQLGYYVANTRPVSVCALLTPPDEARYVSPNTVVMRAPGLQGTYGGGDCDTKFFFDATTDAYIEFPSRMGLITDQPLSIRSEPITVVVKPLQ